MVRDMNNDPTKLINEMTKRMENMDPEHYKSTVLKTIHKMDSNHPLLKEMESMPAEQFKQNTIRQIKELPSDLFILKNKPKAINNLDLNQQITLQNPQSKLKPKDKQYYNFEPIQNFYPKDSQKKIPNISYFLTQNSQSEQPGSGEFFKKFTTGYYNCIVCDKRLFSSKQKYESNYPFASFNAAIGDIDEIELGYGKLIKADCLNCGAHLGVIS